jgi:hypothetical protein
MPRYPPQGGGIADLKTLFSQKIKALANDPADCINMETLVNAGLLTIDQVASYINSIGTADFWAGILMAYTNSFCASILNSTNISASRAASIINSDNMTYSKAASIFNNTNLSVGKLADIFGHSNLSDSKATSIFNSMTRATSDLALIFNDADVPASRAAYVTQNTTKDTSTLASIFNNTNLLASKAASILNDTNLTESKIASIIDNANLSGSRAGAILSHANLTTSKTISILNAMSTINKLMGNVKWSEDFSTLWNTVEIYDPDNDASVTVSSDTTTVFRDMPRSMKHYHTDPGGDYESSEASYKTVSISLSGLTKALIYFPLYHAQASGVHGNLKVIITYTDTGGQTRTIQYILCKGSTWQDPVTTNITIDLSDIPLGAWYKLTRDFLSDTSTYPPSTITEIRIRTGTYGVPNNVYASGLMIIGG